MARCLAREGHEVTVWNRTPARAEAVQGDGITACGAIADALLGGADMAAVRVAFDR